MQVDEQAEDQGVAWTPPATCPKFRERPLPGIDTPDAVVWSVSCQGALSAEGARRVAPQTPLSPLYLPFSSAPQPLPWETRRAGAYGTRFISKTVACFCVVCAAEWKQVGCVL